MAGKAQGMVAFANSNLFQGGPGSVRFGYGSRVEQFEQVQFSVRTVPLEVRFLCVSFSTGLKQRYGSGSGFRSRGTAPAVPLLLAPPGKTVLAVPVFGSCTILSVIGKMKGFTNGNSR